MGNTPKKNDDPVWLRIKSLRTGTRGEQTRLMEFCGLAQNTYNGWDTGLLKSYNKYVDKIAAFYSVSADWILTGEQKEKPTTVVGSELNAERIKLMLSKMSDAELIQLIADASDILRKKGEE